MKSLVTVALFLMGLIIIAVIDHATVKGGRELFPIAVTHGDEVTDFQLKEIP